MIPVSVHIEINKISHVSPYHNRKPGKPPPPGPLRDALWPVPVLSLCPGLLMKLLTSGADIGALWPANVKAVAPVLEPACVCIVVAIWLC